MAENPQQLLRMIFLVSFRPRGLRTIGINHASKSAKFEVLATTTHDTIERFRDRDGLKQKSNLVLMTMTSSRERILVKLCAVCALPGWLSVIMSVSSELFFLLQQEVFVNIYIYEW